MTRKITRKKDKGSQDAGHGSAIYEGTNGEHVEDSAGPGGSSQRVREHGLRVMRATREQLDNALLERARQAVIDSALQDENGMKDHIDGEKAHIDKRKNLQTIRTLLQKHTTSQDMQHNIAAILQDITRH